MPLCGVAERSACQTGAETVNGVQSPEGARVCPKLLPEG